MNIKQAKARFTELTGLPAKAKWIHQGIWNCKGWVADFMKSLEAKEDFSWDDCDTRKTRYWVELVAYLESLQEVA